jgi:AmpD protein
MEIILETGLLQGVDYQASPNCDDRPSGTEVELLVIHGISLPPGQFGGPYINDLFLNRLDPNAHPYFEAIHKLTVSAHFLIRRDGVITQFVPLQKRAWHAGVSEFCGRQRCNDFSVGIELEGADDIPYEDIQYERLSELTRAIQRVFPRIGQDNIVGHCDIAPGRKTDPGLAFDWARYRRRLTEFV